MRPMPFKWIDGVMVPRYPRLAHEQFDPGQFYVMEAQEERSDASHRHFFAMIREAWKNLPEDAAERFASPDKLRKWSLIKAGYHDEETFVCDSLAAAERLAAFVRRRDDYAVVIVRERTLTVYTAKSQSMAAMGKKDFQDSKTKVMEIVADMIGVTPDQLSASSQGPVRANNPAGAAAA